MQPKPSQLDTTGDFGPFNDRIWLNCSHQGPLPRVAIEAAKKALDLKIRPFELSTSLPFSTVPRQLREALAALIDEPVGEIILGNSTSYGLNLLANGFSWRSGDEVLLVKGDFPATIFAWLPLVERGVRIRFIEPRGACVTADELQENVTASTRLFCTTWVHSFTGCVVDETTLGQVCAQHNVVFVLNGSQGVGNRPIQPRSKGVDVLTSCGFKWLVGPYGTGFCWIRPELREKLLPTKGYWLANLSADDLARDFTYQLRDNLGSRAYDLFCTANFLNYMPWTASIQYLLGHGIQKIQAHNKHLVSHLIKNLDRRHYELLSPERGREQGSIVVLRHRKTEKTRECFQRLRDAGIDVAFRKGNLRVSPHLYNCQADIERLLDILQG